MSAIAGIGPYRSTLVGVTITELVVVLLFVVFIYSQEGDRTQFKMSQEISKLKQNNRELTNINREHEQKIKNLTNSLKTIEKEVTLLIRALGGRTFNPERDGGVSEEIQKWIEKLTKGTGHPNCLPGNNYLYTITMLDGEYKVQTEFNGSTSATGVPLPEVAGSIAERSKIKKREFSKLAGQVFEWSTKPEQDCRFWVKVKDQTTQKSTYKSQLLLIREYFYWTPRD